MYDSFRGPSAEKLSCSEKSVFEKVVKRKKKLLHFQLVSPLLCPFLKKKQRPRKSLIFNLIQGIHKKKKKPTTSPQVLGAANFTVTPTSKKKKSISEFKGRRGVKTLTGGNKILKKKTGNDRPRNKAKAYNRTRLPKNREGDPVASDLVSAGPDLL